MWGAIVGDIIGSAYEFNNVKNTDFDLFVSDSVFTDDSVLTVAVADSIMNNIPIAKALREYWASYAVGYGDRFEKWARNDWEEAYNSWGNGSAMRISPVAYAYNSLDDVLSAAERFTVVTHNHPDGIKGAKATAAAIYLARTGTGKLDIKNYIGSSFGYDLSRTCDEIRPNYEFDESCQGTVPEAIIAFLESVDFESAIRLSISLGGDSDTLGCITGSIAEPFYKGVPDSILKACKIRLDDRLHSVITQFTQKFIE